jgi:hypothetical protein
MSFAEVRLNICIVSFQNNVLSWENDLAARLQAAGYNVCIDYRESGPALPFLKAVLAMESRRTGVVAGARPISLASSPNENPDVIIDLTGKNLPSGVPTLTVEICGSQVLAEGLLRLRAGSGLVDLIVRCDGQPVAHASPMISDRVWLSRDVKELLVSVQSLFLLCLARLKAGLLEPIAVPPVDLPLHRPELGYLASFVGGLATRALKKITPGSRDFSWRTAYRFIDGPGIAERQKIDGKPFAFLEDDGRRFYADPFPVDHEGKYHLFVEEYPYASRRGVISVAELDADGHFSSPRIVLEEPHHLSYPNVFAHEGQFFMIPESSAANEVVLYRADPFPYRWRREAILIEGIGFADATLFSHGGRYWMFGTELFAGGNASDTMTLYGADRLRGPWMPHPLNPVIIDRAGARPGGKIVKVQGRYFLPVQNGTTTYGGGLGLREILHLDVRDVRLGPTMPILDPTGRGKASLHTLNRAGRLEVTDRLSG